MTDIQLGNYLCIGFRVYLGIAVLFYARWCFVSPHVGPDLKAPAVLIWTVAFLCLCWPVWFPLWLITWPFRWVRRKWRESKERIRAEFEAHEKREHEALADNQQKLRAQAHDLQMFGRCFGSTHQINAAGAGAVNFGKLDRGQLQFIQQSAAFGWPDHPDSPFVVGDFEIEIRRRNQQKTPYSAPQQPRRGSKHSYEALEALFTAVESITYPDALLHGPLTDGPEMREVNEALKRLYAERAEMEKPDGDV